MREPETLFERLVVSEPADKRLLCSKSLADIGFISNLFRFENRQHDRGVAEENRLEPLVRLIFSGLLAFIIALAFHLKVNASSIASEEPELAGKRPSSRTASMNWHARYQSVPR